MFSEQLRQEAELRFQRRCPTLDRERRRFSARWVSAVRKNRY